MLRSMTNRNTVLPRGSVEDPLVIFIWELELMERRYVVMVVGSVKMSLLSVQFLRRILRELVRTPDAPLVVSGDQ